MPSACRARSNRASSTSESFSGDVKIKTSPLRPRQIMMVKILGLRRRSSKWWLPSGSNLQINLTRTCQQLQPEIEARIKPKITASYRTSWLLWVAPMPLREPLFPCPRPLTQSSRAQASIYLSQTRQWLLEALRTDLWSHSLMRLSPTAVHRTSALSSASLSTDPALTRRNEGVNLIEKPEKHHFSRQRRQDMSSVAPTKDYINYVHPERDKLAHNNIFLWGHQQ